jgi:hypothetical protein
VLFIQLLLIAMAIGIGVYFVVHRGQARAAAWAKILFLAFLVFGAYALLRPDDLTRIARLVGVGRGADLVLYGLVLCFAFMTVSSYLKFLEIETRLARLARAVAIDEAKRINAASVRQSASRPDGDGDQHEDQHGLA